MLIAVYIRFSVATFILCVSEEAIFKIIYTIKTIFNCIIWLGSIVGWIVCNYSLRGA